MAALLKSGVIMNATLAHCLNERQGARVTTPSAGRAIDLFEAANEKHSATTVNRIPNGYA